MPRIAEIEFLRVTILGRISTVSNRFLFVLAAIISLHLAGNCRADDSIWRFGFYWSITATTYPPKKVPWSKYTHISQFAILPTPSCGIDARTYMVDRVQTDLVRTAHHNQVKIRPPLVLDRAQADLFLEACADVVDDT